MKFNEEAYELAKEIHEISEKIIVPNYVPPKNDEGKEQELLKLLFKRFKKDLDAGFIHLTAKIDEYDPEYCLIDKMENIYQFETEYCMDIEYLDYGSEERNACIRVTWDAFAYYNHYKDKEEQFVKKIGSKE